MFKTRYIIAGVALASSLAISDQAVKAASFYDAKRSTSLPAPEPAVVPTRHCV